MNTTIPENVITWLLQDSNPSVKARTLMELLGQDEVCPEVLQAKERLAGSIAALKILAPVRPDGEWPRLGPSAISPEMGFSYLGELGLDKTHPVVKAAAEIFLSHQYADGSFLDSYTTRESYYNPRPNDSSCYYALTIRGLMHLGYRNDPRVRKAIDFCLTQSRHDGGYLCTKSYVKKNTKSCIRGSKNVLLLFSELPEVWSSSQCQRLVKYFLERRIFYKRSDPAQFVTGRPATLFPFDYRLGLLEPLYALSKMGYGHHPALNEAWQMLSQKRDEMGRYNLDWKSPKCGFNPGEKGQANPWVTLYAYLALKYRDEVIYQPAKGEGGAC
jgi:hypothetical protein